MCINHAQKFYTVNPVCNDTPWDQKRSLFRGGVFGRVRWKILITNALFNLKKLSCF